MKIYLLIICVLLFLPFSLPQQENLQTLPLDTLNIKSDSLGISKPKSSSYGVDSTIFITAKDSLIFYVKDKKMKIYGEANLNYKLTEMKSANISIDFNKSEIEATGISIDTIPGNLKGAPVLKEGEEVYEGSRMKYNYKTGQGLLSVVKTEQEGARYSGTKIKKVDKDTYFIEDGIYTTCDETCPHYYFSAAKMKVIQKDQLVAEWIFLNFGGVPFPIPLPFAVFPIESGRRSGILPPVFGSDAAFGTYFSRFGYFWAISDYMDLNMTADYYTRGSYKLDSRFRYAKRYSYSGNIEGSYGSFATGEESDLDRTERTDWRIKWNHNQSITPTLRLDAKLEFLSGSNIQRNVDDFNEILRNEAISNATLFKQWDESGNSLSLSYSRSQNFENGNRSEVLPNLTFSLAQAYPFRKSGSDKAWYETFGYNYSGQFQNNRNKTEGDLRIRGGIQHNIRASLSPKIGYFSISPSFNYNESWYNKRVNKGIIKSASTGKDTLFTEDVKEINFVRTFSLGVTASTKFYGMFTPNVLGISAIRHTVTPAVSYSYQPDFSTDFWGYYDSYKDSTGKDIKYNKFEREIFSRPTGREQQVINFSVGNIFEMKSTVDPTDTTAKETKTQLLNLNANIGYDFAADSLKFTDLRLSYRTQVGKFFSFSGGSSLTLYDYAPNVPRINKFLISEGKGLFRLTNFFISLSLTLSGDKISTPDSKSTASSLPQEDYFLGQSERGIYQGLYNDEDADFSIPWDLTLNYNYNENRPTPLAITKNSNLSGSFNFNLTPKWKFSVTGSYDIERNEFAAPQVRISRDLHCWMMNFTWNPIGTYRGYRFEIRVKAPQLQDLKITKRDQFFEGR